MTEQMLQEEGLGDPSYKIEVECDEEGFTIYSENLTTLEKKVFRLDSMGEGIFRRYRQDKKPSCRTTELVDLGKDVEDYLTQHASFFV